MLSVLRLYWNSGKQNGNYYLGFGAWVVARARMCVQLGLSQRMPDRQPYVSDTCRSGAWDVRVDGSVPRTSTVIPAQRGPQYRPPKTTTLIIGTPQKLPTMSGETLNPEPQIYA